MTVKLQKRLNEVLYEREDGKKGLRTGRNEAYC